MPSAVYKLKISDSLVKFIRNLHPQLKRKIRAGLGTIAADPDQGKSLKQELAGLKSFRVGQHRIIYRVPRKKIIEIIAIGPRKNIYTETYRYLSKKKSI